MKTFEELTKVSSQNMPLRRAIWGLQLEVHLAFLAKSLVYHTTHPWVLILFLPI